MLRLKITGLILLLTLAAPPSLALAAGSGRSPAQPARSHGFQNRKSLQAFLDRIIRSKMATYHAPGLGISVVQNGRVLLSKGYGYADLQRRIPVSPERTIWRMASVAVPFTATAVLQLAERQQVGLHVNVNHYLRQLSVPHTYPQPITSADLLTQSGGFDDPSFHDETLDPAAIQPFCRYLRQNLPVRAMPPGQLTSTSDWNTTLAGCVVEDASGVPFERYVDQHIFRPLGMRHSTFVQPVPSTLAPYRATGYDGDLTAANRPPGPEAYNLTVPAAALRSSVSDITRFMLAQLNGGQLRGRRILQPHSVRAMQQLQFTNYRGLGSYPPPAGFGYGFNWGRQNGETILSADGGVRGFTSLMTLVPKRKFGVFLVTNVGDAPWIFDIQRQILDRVFLPQHPRRPTTPPALRTSLDPFTGTFWGNAYARHTIQKLGQLNRQVQISANGGTLTATFWDGSQVQMTRIAPLLFQTTFQGTPFYFGFRMDRTGHAAHFLNGPDAFDRINWYETTQIQTGLIGLFTLIFLTGVLMWVLLPLIRRRPSGPTNTPLKGMNLTTSAVWPLVGLLCALNLAAIIFMFALLQTDSTLSDQQYDLFTYSMPWFIYVLASAFIVTSVLAIVVAGLGIVSWRHVQWSALRRAHYAVIAVTGLAFIPFLQYWNLLGFNW